MTEGGLIASVVVPAYNAEATIAECIEALLQQSVPPSDFEVIVVDDGSTDATQEIAANYGVKVLSQPHSGVGAARNLGVDRAQSEIVLFTDADCTPAPDWLESLLGAFDAPDISGAKGIYKTHQTSLMARFAQLEYEDKYDKMSKDEYIDFVDTYCAAYRKSVFSRDGSFDPTFHRSGEDVEFSYRLAEKGHQMVFVPQAIVYHHHVDSPWDYLKRKFYVGYWRVLMYRKHPGKIWKDSHTPQVLKVQVALVPLLFALTLAIPLRPQLVFGVAASILIFFATSIPFATRNWHKDRTVSAFAPLLLFARAVALASGLVTGLLGQLVGKMKSR